MTYYNFLLGYSNLNLPYFGSLMDTIWTLKRIILHPYHISNIYPYNMG